MDICRVHVRIRISRDALRYAISREVWSATLARSIVKSNSGSEIQTREKEMSA